MRNGNKIKLTAIIIVLILVIGVIVCQYIDSNAAMVSITEVEYRDIQGIPETMSDEEVQEVRDLLKETDIMIFRLEQHRQELEKLIEKNK
jgi:cell division septal protein FtsQ